MTDENVQDFLNDIVKQLNNLYWINKKSTFKDLAEPLDKIFKNSTITNLFLNDLTLSKTLFNYISTTKLDFYYELFDYLVNKFKDDKDMLEMFNVFKFNNGLFTDMKIKDIIELNDERQTKMLNTVLILNNQPTQNKKYNDILNYIKFTDLNDFKFNDIFNDVLFNNIQNNYNFKFMDRYEKFLIRSEQTKQQTNNVVNFRYLDVMDNYILKYNDNSKVFKMWFYMLLSYIYDKTLSFKELLNIFLNANLIFYNKLINLNNSFSCLITYIYFTSNDSKHPYVPNLRYTIDIKGDSTEDKIKYLIDINKNPINNFDEFKTTIEHDDKGIYFKTCEYKQDEFIKHAEKLVKDGDFNKLVYYIFNSQFLNRSTCLFGYYIYYYYTKYVLKNNYYFDIIALTRTFDEFNEIINDGDNKIKFDGIEHIEHLTINDFIKFIK